MATAIARGRAKRASNPMRKRASLNSTGSMKAMGNATAATAASAMNHLSWWRSTSVPRR